jgi:histidinol-phosphate/aromatic aminotransferase/cobyric acid decarboxylase-like protein
MRSGTRTSNIEWTRKHANLIVLKTFSKAYGLAGLRVGYAVSPKKLISQMYKAKAPYNVNAISEGIAAMALMERKFLASTVRRIAHERDKMTRKLGELGFSVYPSVTNFLLAKSPIKSRTLWNRLCKRGIVINIGQPDPECKAPQSPGAFPQQVTPRESSVA